MRALDLIVINVGPLKPSNLNEFPYHYIVLKNVDPNDTTKYALNLQKRTDTKKGDINYNNWYNNAKKGAVLNCVMQDRYPSNVDQWKEFKVVKVAHEAPRRIIDDQPTEKNENASQLIIGIELDKIEASIKKIREEIK